MRLAELLPLARDSVTDPRAGFRRMLALDLDRATLWQAMIAVSLISVVLFLAGDRLTTLRGGTSMLPWLPGPLILAFISFAGQALVAYLLFWGGRMLGGAGTFEGALLAVTWLQFVLDCLVVVQLALLLVLPPLAGIVGLLGFGLSFWLLSGFTAEMHGFRSMGRTFAGILIGLLGLAMVLTLVLMVIGFSLPEPPDV